MRLFRMNAAFVLACLAVHTSPLLNDPDLYAQTVAPPQTLSKEVLKYVRVQAPKIVLTHVRVIDGTGRDAVDDQNVVIEGGNYRDDATEAPAPEAIEVGVRDDN